MPEGVTSSDHADAPDAEQLRSVRIAPARRAAFASEAVLLVSVIAVVGVAYWLIGVPVYNDAAWLDPWYYTGLWVDFSFLHSAFHGAYYVTRLPWLVPGRAAFALLSPSAAYLVVHLLYGGAAAGALYLLLRRFFGHVAAAAAVAVAALNPLVYHTFYRDYVVTGEATYLLLALYFGLSGRSGRRPRLAMGAAGFFVAAAFATHFFSGMFSALLVVPYAILIRPNRRELLGDAAAFAAGLAALFVVCGVYSKETGGPFDFLGPAFQTTTDLQLAQYHIAGLSWLLDEPRFVVVPFVLVFVAIVARSRALAEPTRRFVHAVLAYSLLAWLIVTVWELDGGFIYENIDYNEAWMMTGFLPALGVAIALLVTATSPRIALVTAVMAAAVPPLALYRWNENGWVGGRAFIVTLVGLALVAVIVTLARVRVAPRAMRIATIALLALTTSYGFTGSAQVASAMNLSSSRNRLNAGVFHVGVRWLRWMQRQGLQDQYMETWYDQRQMPWGTGLASFYFYGWILQGADMPKIDSAFRQTWAQRTPSEIVMLCTEPSCRGGQAALRRAGYAVRFRAMRHFVSGPVSLWVRVLTVVGGGPPQ